MAQTRRTVGAAGEEIAAQALQDAGLEILARNWRCAVGEIDIVAAERAMDYASGKPDARWLVLVEVRTRRGQTFGTARQAFPPRKQAKLREVAAQYVQETGWTGPWRIDAMAVQMDRQGRVQAVEHIRHAITG